MIPNYDDLNNKQKWAVNKLHKIAKNSSTPIIYFYFADVSNSEKLEIDLGAIAYIPDYETDRPDSKKAEKKRLLKGLKELQDLGLIEIIHSHNWKIHEARLIPLDNLSKELRGK